MRLFTALWPPGPAVDHLRARMPAQWPAGIRGVPPARWHVTLRFHGDDVDPDTCTERLAQLSGAPAPRLRLAGSGTFTGVLWVGVRPATATDARALTDLAAAAGADPGAYRAHVTVARWRRGTPAPSGLLTRYRGPEWTPSEVTLVTSALGSDGPHYTVLRRVPLAVPPRRD